MLEAAALLAQESGLSTWASRDPWAYPVANVVHLVGLVLLVGSAWAMDVAVLRSVPRERLGPLLAAGRRSALAGLALMLPSGAILFAADAEALVGNAVFRWKLVVIGLALLNAAAFQLGQGGRPAAVSQAMALVSMLAWLAVLTLGRWIAYA